MPLNESDVVLGRYRIEARLGEGGMGAVYRAFDTLHDQPCALKEFRLGHLPSEADARPEDGTRLQGSSKAPAVTREKAAEQFRREARLLARLDHPNLPRVTDYLSLGDDHYLVMTLVEGRDLAAVLAAAPGRPLAEAQALAWIDQVLDALAYCHSQGVIHRDVKPANMVVTPEGKVYLVDFGIAKPDDPSGQTTVGARATTPGYSPPEQYGGRGCTDARSDVYAVGATLYALLTGHEPIEAIDRLQGRELPRPCTLAPDVSPSVDAAVMRALALKPADRFQSAGELRAALRDARGSDEELLHRLDELLDAHLAGDQARVRALLDELAALRGFKPAPAEGAQPQAEAASAPPTGRWVPLPPPAPPHTVRSSGAPGGEAYRCLETVHGPRAALRSVAFSPDATLAATGTVEGKVLLWRISDGAVQHTLERHQGAVFGTAFSPDGRLVASASLDGTIYLWQVADGGLYAALKAHGTPHRLQGVAFAPGGGILASASDDGRVRLWSTADGRLLQALAPHELPVYGVAISPDGGLLASASYDAEVHLWRTADWRLVAALAGHGHGARCVAFSPDSATLAAGSCDETVRLWQVAGTGQEQPWLLRELAAGNERRVIRSLAIAPRSDLLAAAAGSVIWLWRVSDGHLVQGLREHTGEVLSLAFMEDGVTLLSASDDGTVRRWGPE